MLPVRLALAGCLLLSLALTVGCGRRAAMDSRDAFAHRAGERSDLAARPDHHWTLRAGNPVAVPGKSPESRILASGEYTLLATGAPVPSLSLLPADGGAPPALAPLPAGSIPVCATFWRERIYVVVSRGPDELRLLAAPVTTAAAWQDLGLLPPGARGAFAMAVQSTGERPHLLVFARPAPTGSTVVSFYEPERAQWKSARMPLDLPGEFLVVPSGIANLFILSREGPPELRIYNTITQSLGAVHPMQWPGRLVDARVAGTELRTLSVTPDGRPHLTVSTYRIRAQGLHGADYAVIAGCGLLLLGIALVNSRRFKSAESYFRGGRNIPWFAAALSVVATGQSATSFISLPARAFATNLQFALVPLTNIFGALIMSRYFVRFFVRLNITSAYEYLEVRFSPLMRTLGSINYLAYELTRISLLILVPAVAVSAVTRVDITLAILLMGTVATIYTTLGGLEGVVWADVVQIFIKIAAILLVVGMIFARLEGSLAELAQQAWHEGKLRAVDWSFDLTRDTIWALLLFWFTDGLKSYVANQTVIQRFISTRDEKAAQRSVRASAIVGTLIFWTFMIAGTGLYLFYRQNPDRFDAVMDKPDAVFPWFIVFELPPGIAGLVITALIAAAFSSLYGALNSTSTVMVTDFYRRFSSRATDEGAVRLGRRLTLMTGVVATALSLLLAGLASRSLVEQTLSVVGLFGGGLGGLFLVGMLTTRVSMRAALVGYIISACVQFYVSRYTSLHWLTYMFTGMGSCFVGALLASLVWRETRPLTGLTVHTCRD